jgi:hypothetical protein
VTRLRQLALELRRQLPPRQVKSPAGHWQPATIGVAATADGTPLRGRCRISSTASAGQCRWAKSSHVESAPPIAGATK